jgi:nicotinamide mononucleotide (NMN) deamidase PncC
MVFAAVAGPHGVSGREYRLVGNRSEIRHQAVAACLELLAQECGMAASP